MKKYAGFLFLAVLLFILSGCGAASKEEVIEELEKTASDLKGYKATATMNLKTSGEVQSYGIDVWYQKDNNYRVLLKNDQDAKGSQVILRNKDGVFVLTPALKKSFKFQSEWPYNSSQPYLFQSLVQDVQEDSDAVFRTTEDHYVFETKTAYQNNTTLPYQEIYFDKKSYTPEMVKVLDKDKKAVVEVAFTAFKKNPTFSGDSFELDSNMTSALGDVTVSAQPSEQQALSVLYPQETAGAELAEEKKISLENGERVILTYEGSKHFTLIQQQETLDETTEAVTAAAPVNGEPISLGFTVGAMTSATLEWNQDGTDYILASEELTREEMIEVAGSVSGQMAK